MTKNIQQELSKILYEIELNGHQATLEAINSLVRECIGEEEPKPRLEDATHMTQALEVKWRNQKRQQFLDRWFSNKGEGDE